MERETRDSTATCHFPLIFESRILKVGANKPIQVMTTSSVTKVESPRGLVVLLLCVCGFPRWLETTGQTLEGRDLKRPLRVKTSRYLPFRTGHHSWTARVCFSWAVQRHHRDVFGTPVFQQSMELEVQRT